MGEIGRGAAGIVYKAEDAKGKQPVALKAIWAEAGRPDESAIEAVRTIMALSHPNIAAIYDVFGEEQQVYIAFEYVSGVSLETMLRRMALPEKPVLLHCFEQVAEALDYADARGVVHRDIKPSNILVTETAGAGGVTAKITDFGVSRLVPHEMNSSGGMVGTPSYLSPEEIQGAAIDGRSDQFSLAVMVYEVLSGTKPFIADNLSTIFYQICEQPARSIEQTNTSLTPEVGQVLQRALAKNPAQRYPSCTDFLEALGKALREIPEWAAAVAPRRVAAAAPISPREITPKTEAPKHLPSLPKHRNLLDDEARETPRHSPLKLLAAMLVLSAVVIALTFLFEQWHWQPRLPRSAATSSQTAQTAKRTSPEKADNAALADREPEKQGGKKEAQSTPKAEVPPVSNPIAGPPPPVLKPVPVPRRQDSSPVSGSIAAVDLLSEPPGATIIVDGNRSTSCRAPCTMSLPNGRHTATVQLGGYNIARRVFNVPEDSGLITPLSKSTGTLVVTSQPAGSPIVIDNKPYGTTPRTLQLPAGPHKLVLTNGQMQHRETIEVVAGELTTRSLRWQ